MKLPLMVLLSIKSKSYGRLHRTHYKQVIFMCKFWLSRSCWVGYCEDTKGELMKKWMRFHASVLYNISIEGRHLRVSHTSKKKISPLFPLPVHSGLLITSVLLGASMWRTQLLSVESWVLHICQRPHTTFTPQHQNTDTALARFK